jgi:hypothetical protein
MKKNQKGFNTIFIILPATVIFLIIALLYVYTDKTDLQNNNLAQREDTLNIKNGNTTDCLNLSGDQVKLCELRKAYKTSNTISEISLQKDPLNLDIVTMSGEITNINNPASYRIYMANKLRSEAGSKWLEKDISLIKSTLISVILNNNDDEKVRGELMMIVPKIYYYAKVKNIDDIFSANTKMLNNEKDSLSVYAASSLVGTMADLELNRSMQTANDFVKDYKLNYTNRPNTLITILIALKASNTTDTITKQAISYVCSQGNLNAKRICL